MALAVSAPAILASAKYPYQLPSLPWTILSWSPSTSTRGSAAKSSPLLMVRSESRTTTSTTLRPVNTLSNIAFSADTYRFALVDWAAASGMAPGMANVTPPATMMVASMILVTEKFNSSQGDTMSTKGMIWYRACTPQPA